VLDVVVRERLAGLVWSSCNPDGTRRRVWAAIPRTVTVTALIVLGLDRKPERLLTPTHARSADLSSADLQSNAPSRKFMLGST
jgi:hypothetical protein